MKTIIPWILLLILSAIFLADHFSGKPDLEKLLAPYKEQKLKDDKVIADLRADIVVRDENIGQLNGELDSNATVIEAFKKKAAVAETAVIEARKGWAAFSIEAQAKLQELDNAWSAKFSVAQEEIQKWGEREKVWQRKDVEYQAKVSDLEGIIKAKDRTNVACENAQKDIGKALVKERRASRLKTWIAVGAGAVGFFAGRA
jgi:hypothetical protein